MTAASRDYGLTIGTRDAEKIALADLGREIVYAPNAETEQRKAPLVGRRGFELQQLGQGCSSGLMHRRAHCHLDGFQIQIAGLAARVKDHSQQLVYFAPDLLADRFRLFFSAGDIPSSPTGRKRQICSLTRTSSRQSSWKR